MAGKKLLFCPFDTKELEFIYTVLDEDQRANRKEYEKEGWNEISNRIKDKCNNLIDQANRPDYKE